ncbi:MAG: septal ring lytic transglycosylase RlpA family protein [Acidobacteriota bacterium]|nr:septal ring lytic transglycosylase RlpA family protein [Acidobacteriota bacterium]
MFFASSTLSAFLRLRRRGASAALFLALIVLALVAAGCGHKQTARNVPPPPGIQQPEAGSEAQAKPHRKKPSNRPPTPEGQVNSGIHVDPHAKVIWRQEGYASWYGPQYHMKKAANGEVYDQNQMTAAHNTLPLNSIVRVINEKTRKSAIVRITDRGPFVLDRVIDLSMAAAKALDIYLPGTAPVRIEVLDAPHPIETGGRWCVQMGAFQSQDAALDMKEHLQDRYPTAQVLQFKGPTGYWVRVRVESDDKEQTRKVFDHVKVKEGAVFMVRLD